MKHIKILFCSLILICSVSEAKNCKKGKACGNACIAQSEVCHIEESKPAKNCKKGKPCGNTCIPKDAVCHK